MYGPRKLTELGASRRFGWNPPHMMFSSWRTTSFNQKPVSTHCPIGKEWKGQPWELVDEGFLDWIIMKIDDKPDILEAAKKEKIRRYPEDVAAVEDRAATRIGANGKKLADFARELGEAKNIDQIQVIKDELPADYEPGLRNYIASREEELGPR